MEFNRALQFVATEAAGLDVRSRWSQFQFIQARTQLLWFAAVFVVTGELHAIKTHRCDLRKRGVEILRAIIAHGIKLHGDARVGNASSPKRRLQSERSRSRDECFDEISTGQIGVH